MARRKMLFVAATLSALCACEFIPGTTAYQETQAKEKVARTLIDPSSALFRNVRSEEGVVCGEVNGKNRMGAYVGFVRFYVESSNGVVALEPESDPIGQMAFNSAWTSRCAGRLDPATRMPFDPTRGADNFQDNLALNVDTVNSEDSDLSEAGNAVWLAPPDDETLVDADGNPINSTGRLSDPETRRPAQESEPLNQAWLDRAIGRSKSPEPPPGSRPD